MEVRQRNIKIDSDGWQEALDLELLLDLLGKGEKEKAKTTLLSNLKAKQQLSL